jgi:hypothetical protein
MPVDSRIGPLNSASTMQMYWLNVDGPSVTSFAILMEAPR